MKKKTLRRAITVGVIAFTALVGSVIGSGSASAAPGCNNYLGTSGRTLSVCVEFPGSSLASLPSGGCCFSVDGKAEFLGALGSHATLTVYTVQCSVDITNCVTVGARSGTVASGEWLMHSVVPTALGHIYHSCASGVGVVNGCSPWAAA